MKKLAVHFLASKASSQPNQGKELHADTVQAERY
jgi:hypothetical protein